MTANFVTWSDEHSEWFINVKTPNGRYRRLLFKDNEILYMDENWNTIKRL